MRRAVSFSVLSIYKGDKTVLNIKVNESNKKLLHKSTHVK